MFDVTGKDATEISLKDLSNFRFDNIKLATVMPKTNDNSALYGVLLDVINGDKLTTDPTYVKENAITLNHLSTFNFNNVKLNTVMPKTSSNEGLYKILVDVTGKSANQISLNDLSNFNYNNIKLSTVLPKTQDNQALYDILFDVTGKSATEVALADLSTFKFDGVKLNSVLPVDKVVNGEKVNESLYKILVDVTGKSANQINLSDLSSFEYNKIKLSTVIPTSSNEALYDVLFDITGKDADKLNISDLSNFKFDSVKLNTVLPYENENKEPINTALYNILLDIINGDKQIGDTGYVDKANITIKHLSSFKFDNVKLSSVLSMNEKNENLYNILVDVTGKSADKINISDLYEFNFEGMHLNVILKPEENASLYKVLLDVVNTGKAESEKLKNVDLTLSHLSSFEVSKVHLQTVLGDKATGNVILDKLVEKNVAIDDLGSAINGLSLYEIYGKNCFVESDATGIAKYNLKKDDNGVYFELDSNGKYAINKSAGIWLLLCFDFEFNELDSPINTVTYGCAKKYTISTATLNDLSDSNSGLSISDKLTIATLRQLNDAGILECKKPALYAMTLQDIMGKF